METCADSAPVAFGGTLDDVVRFLRSFQWRRNSVFLPITRGNDYYVRALLARSVLTTW